jgi:hypothetical protein
MTAQAARPTKPTKQPTHKQAVILKTKREHPTLTTREIAAIAETGHSHVIDTLRRYGIDTTHLDQYKRHRADIFAGLQHRMLISVTNDDIQKTPAIQRITGAAILYDKERLERGQSTVNLAQLVAHVEDLQRIESE